MEGNMHQARSSRYMQYEAIDFDMLPPCWSCSSYRQTIMNAIIIILQIGTRLFCSSSLGMVTLISMGENQDGYTMIKVYWIDSLLYISASLVSRSNVVMWMKSLTLRTKLLPIRQQPRRQPCSTKLHQKMWSRQTNNLAYFNCSDQNECLFGDLHLLFNVFYRWYHFRQKCFSGGLVLDRSIFIISETETSYKFLDLFMLIRETDASCPPPRFGWMYLVVRWRYLNKPPADLPS